ncbi:MAG: dipeptidase [Thermoanaerobaculia bacterium]|jgi:membrane dipeptidase
MRLLLSALVALLAMPMTTTADDATEAHALRLLREAPLIDGHNDMPYAIRDRVKNHVEQIDFAGDTRKLASPMHTDIARLRAGGVGAQFWSVWIPTDLAPADAVKTVVEQIDVVHRVDARYPDAFALALTADDVLRIHREGRIASMIGVEGGHSIGNSLAVLRQLYALGARYMTLTHSKNTDWADSATDLPRSGGLTPFGKEVVREMNRLGMLVDLSHVAPSTMKQAIEVSDAPVIFSHSSAFAITPHMRNVPDDVLATLKAKDGVVMVTFVGAFVSEEARQWNASKDAEEARLKALHPESEEARKAGLEAWTTANPQPTVTISQVADHVDHIRKVAGVEHVGIGSDFDGFSYPPVGLEGVQGYPALFAELIRRGYTDDEVRAIAGRNLLRVWHKAEAVAATLQKVKRASDVLIEDVDSPVKNESPTTHE